MVSAPADDKLFDEFLSEHGHETDQQQWEESYNKKQCPECGALHDTARAECSVCGWSSTLAQ